MFRPQTRESARAALLDRLVDKSPDVSQEPKPLRTLDRAELRQSVRRELERLLNTRSSYAPEILNQMERTVVNYGIPDYYHLSPKSLEDQKTLSRELGRTISIYEPRLQDVHVVIEGYDDDKKSLMAGVRGVIVVESIRDPVSFPFSIQLKSREYDLDGNR